MGLNERVRLAPGVRVTERGYGAWQVGLHHDRRLLLTASPGDLALLERLRTGLDPAGALPAGERELLARCDRAGLLVDGTPAAAPPPVTLDAPADLRATVGRALTDAGLRTTDDPDGPLTLVVRAGCEPRREDLDPLVQADRAHLLLTVVAGRARVGPLVVPGVTACQRCVDEHHTDRDPRHQLVLHHHHERDATDRVGTADLALALAWAARDARLHLTGGQPTTWSATVDVAEAGPQRRTWARHPRCGCAWGGWEQRVG